MHACEALKGVPKGPTRITGRGAGIPSAPGATWARRRQTAMKPSVFYVFCTLEDEQSITEHNRASGPMVVFGRSIGSLAALHLAALGHGEA